MSGDARAPPPGVAVIAIRYVSREGRKTERTITVFRLELFQPGPISSYGVIHARCHMRNAKRAFLLERVEAAYDPETGEIIANLPYYLGTRVPVVQP